jgi:hypothetical protein
MFFAAETQEFFMNCTCPACGRRTDLEADAADFPTRCYRCGNFVRPPAEINGVGAVGRPVRMAGSSQPAPRLARGALAGWLTTAAHERMGVGAPDAPKIPTATPADAAQSFPRHRLRPECMRELAHAAARQKAFRCAELRGKFLALGFLGNLGFMMAALLSLSALALSARDHWFRPAQARADVLQTTPHDLINHQ